MTKEEVGRQAEGEQEPAAPPTPAIASGDSAVAGSAEPSFDADALADKMLEKLVPVLDNKIDARFKSAKDKRLAKVEEILSAVQEAGGDPEKVRGRLEQRELYERLDALEASIRSGGAVGAATEPDIQSDTAKILQDADISFDDPDVAKWAGKSFTSETQALTALKALVTKRAKQGNVTSAATVGAAGKPAPEGDSYAELGERLAELRGKFDEESQKSRREIQAKMAELERDISFVEAKYDAFG